MRYKPIPKLMLFLLALLLIFTQTGLAGPWAAPLWGSYTGAGASAIGGTSGGSGFTLVGASYPPSRLSRADYQQFYNEAVKLYNTGYNFRYNQLTADPVGGELRYGSVITKVIQNYADFNDGALFYDFCADYDAVDERGYCPEGVNPGTGASSANLRNDLLRARDMFAVLSVADPANMTITTAGGKPLNAREVGRQGVLSSTREIANIHMIFGNEFLADANDFTFSSSGSSSATSGIIGEELKQLGYARQQFELATDVLADAFNADIGGPFGVHIGDYFGVPDFDLFGIVSERLTEALDQIAQRYRLLGQDDKAAALYAEAAQDQYLLILALDAEAEERGVSFYDNGGWQMLQNIEYLNQQASAVQAGLDPFGFEATYVPWQTYDNLLGLSRTLLNDAEQDAAVAAAAQREFDYNQGDVGGALQAIREEYDSQLHELCGMAPDANGDGVIDDGFTCEGGLMQANYNDMLAAAKEIQLAWQRAANVVEEIKIQEELAKQVIRITGGLGREISVIELAIGKLNAIQTTSSIIDSTSDTWHAETEYEVRAYEKASATLSANPVEMDSSVEIGIEVSMSAKEGYRHEQSRTEEVETTFNINELGIGQYESLRALQEAEAACKIEGANSAAVIKTLLLEQSELLIEHELALLSWNKLADEHNYLVERYHYLINQRELAINGLVTSYLNNPAYRILRDSLNIEAARSMNLAAQYAYLTAKVVEYNQLRPPSTGDMQMSDIFKARTADDVDNYLGQIEIVAQEAKPGSVNRYPISLSLAEDIFGLTDENLDPQGHLTPAELAQLRYQLFQQIIQENTENDVLELTFTTSLLGDEVHFPSIVWNHRIVGVGSNLDPENAGEGCTIDSPCEGVSVNLLTRQTDTFDVPPFVTLTHAGQTTYRNRDSEIVAYKLGPAMPVGWSRAGDPGSTTVQLRAQVNGEFNAAGNPYNAGLMLLSVAASKWTLRINTTQGAAAELQLAQLEDIVLNLDAHAYALQGQDLAAAAAAQVSQAEFAARPQQPVRYTQHVGDVLSRWEAANAARRAANPPLPTLEEYYARVADASEADAHTRHALAATTALSGTFYGTVAITEPLGVGIFDFVLHLTNANGTLSGIVEPAESLLFSETVAVTGMFDGSTYWLQSAPFTSPAPNPDPRMDSRRQFTLSGPFLGSGKVLQGVYTETVTGFTPEALHCSGEFLGTRVSEIGSNFGADLIVSTANAAIAPNASTSITAIIMEAGQTITMPRRITFTTNLGTVSPTSVNTNIDGHAVTTYTAPGVEGTALITATDGALIGTTQVRVTTGDIDPPSITGVSPIAESTDVALNSALAVTFDEAMATGSIVYSIEPVVPLTPRWSNGDTTMRFSHPHFISNTTYTVTISAGKDAADNLLDNVPYTWAFTTGTSYNTFVIYLPLVLKN
ncbi:MAG: Ig-like domain-containing protein [Anaerolineae bacterium]|nr:Ig-like domain-containing protein [Anaerolineae bacterium]